MKLMYLADRLSIQRHLWPISGGPYASMKNGPVLSDPYNIITEQEDWTVSNGTWGRLLKNSVYPDIELARAFEARALSQANLESLEQVQIDFAHMTTPQLIDFVHSLPEWEDPGDSSVPIPPRRLLRHFGLNDEQIREIGREVLSFASEEVTFRACRDRA
ncbi:MAG: hypothetical protein FD180_3187 [Planctomycetota bacterium]|nr:MAG: hypothetical protein FD180_3187 [Planctomycetota bacterium]